jgi:hypothetical protein
MSMSLVFLITCIVCSLLTLFLSKFEAYIHKMKFGCIVLATTLAGGSAARRLRNTRRLREDTFIFDTVADGTAQATTANTSDKVGTSCSTDDRRVKFMDDDDQDYMDITTTKWHSGGYRMDCVDKGSHTGWQCWATCSPVRCYFVSLSPLVLFCACSHMFDSTFFTHSFRIQILWSGIS